MPAPYIDHIGQVFGRLTVISMADRDKDGNVLWNCICSCGGKKTTRGYSLRRGHVQSCGCLCKERSVGADRKYPTSHDAAWAYNFFQYQRNAKFRKISFDLTFQEFRKICSMSCHYCGAPPEKRPAKRGRSSIMASGIDRIDNNLGYVPSNIVPCCTWCNRAKNSGDVKQFINHCMAVAGKANASIARNE